MNSKIKIALAAAAVIFLVLPMVAKKMQWGHFNPENSIVHYEDRLSLPFKSCRIEWSVSTLPWTVAADKRQAQLLELLSQRLKGGGVSVNEGEKDSVLKVLYREVYSTNIYPGIPSAKDCPAKPLEIVMDIEAIQSGKQIYSESVNSNRYSYQVADKLKPGEFLCDKITRELMSQAYSDFDYQFREKKLFEK